VKSNLTKVILWRIISILVTMLLVYMFTGDIKQTASLTLMFHVIMTGLHYMYEELWDRYIEDR